MPKNRVVIRVDGNSNVGLGHVYRGIAIAEILKKEFEILFLIKASTTIEPIANAGFLYQFIPDEVNELNWLSENVNHKNIVVLDGYSFNEAYQAILKRNGYRLVYIDDLVDGNQKADIVINHALGLKETDYKTASYTKLALGIKYVLLRNLFFDELPKDREIDVFDTPFVCFGGADPLNLTKKVVEALITFSRVKKINIVLGAAYCHEMEIDFFKSIEKVNLYQNVGEQEMLNIMLDSNFAIAPASTTIYELCSVKMPIISGYFVGNQKKIYEGLCKEKVIFPCGNIKSFEQKQFVERIESFFLLEDKQQYLQAQSTMLKDVTPNNLLNLITKL